MKDSKFPVAGSVIFIIAFLYLAWFLTNHAIQLNLATWLLWTMLDISITIGMFRTGNPNKWAMGALTVGAGLIASIAIVQIIGGKTSLIWTFKETITLLCFLTAFAVSKMSKDETFGVNMGTTAMFIAGVPTLIDAWNKPTEQNAVFWVLCVTGSFVTLLGKPKGFTESYLPVGGIIFNGSIAALAMGLIK